MLPIPLVCVEVVGEEAVEVGGERGCVCSRQYSLLVSGEALIVQPVLTCWIEIGGGEAGAVERRNEVVNSLSLTTSDVTSLFSYSIAALNQHDWFTRGLVPWTCSLRFMLMYRMPISLCVLWAV